MPVPSPAYRRATATRRAAIGVVLAGLAAASGCDASRDTTAPTPGVSGSSGGPADNAADGSADASADRDAALVDSVVAEISALAGLVSRVEAKYPRLRAEVRPFRDLHRAHLAVLDAEATSAPADRSRFAGPEAALRTLLARERRGQGRLVEASMSAGSGSLARVLACMSAGVAQQLAVAPGGEGA